MRRPPWPELPESPPDGDCLHRHTERTTEGQQPAGNRADAPQEQTSGPVPDTLRRIGQRSWWEAAPSPS